MENPILSEVKSIYVELQGYLLTSPEPKKDYPQGGFITDASLWNMFNSTLSRLNVVTDNRYVEFQLHATNDRPGGPLYLSVDYYRSNLSGLIFRLHADYFPNNPPYVTKSESGNIVLNQNIHQEQTIYINLFKEQIEEKISSYEEGSMEKSFLEKLKGYVDTTNNITDIVRTTVGLAKKFGLSLDDITNIFS
jgi:hypothetical protein